MMLIPRGSLSAGPVAQNAMAFAGSFFVRTIQELEYVKRVGPSAVLAGVGKAWGEG